jgi:ribosomal protein L37E
MKHYVCDRCGNLFSQERESECPACSHEAAGSLRAPKQPRVGVPRAAEGRGPFAAHHPRDQVVAERNCERLNRENEEWLASG